MSFPKRELSLDAPPPFRSLPIVDQSSRSPLETRQLSRLSIPDPLNGPGGRDLAHNRHQPQSGYEMSQRLPARSERRSLYATAHNKQESTLQPACGLNHDQPDNGMRVASSNGFSANQASNAQTISAKPKPAVCVPHNPDQIPEPKSLEMPQTNGFYYTSLDEALSAIPPPTWRCPSPDPTIPTTDTQRQQWAAKLLAAINNTMDVSDSRAGPSFMKRWYDPIDGPSNYYTPLSKTLLAWSIIALVEALHTTGPSVLLSFDPAFWSRAEKTKDWSFAHRMECIVELLMRSKAKCEKLLANDTLYSVVAFPEGKIRSTRRNQKAGEKRQKDLEGGREAKRLKMGDAEDQMAVRV